MPVKSRSDTIIIASKPTASRLRNICDVLPFSEKSPWFTRASFKTLCRANTQCNNWGVLNVKEVYYTFHIFRSASNIWVTWACRRVSRTQTRLSQITIDGFVSEASRAPMTMTSHGRHYESIHRQLGLFNRFFMLITKKTSKLRITGCLWRETTDEFSQIAKTFPCHCGAMPHKPPDCIRLVPLRQCRWGEERRKSCIPVSTVEPKWGESPVSQSVPSSQIAEKVLYPSQYRRAKVRRKSCVLVSSFESNCGESPVSESVPLAQIVEKFL